MAGISLNHIYKVYPNGAKAVNDFNMKVEDKEFIVFVGPSGCGKSTTLRMIAGLEEITAGELKIGDEIVNDVEPKDRDIAMVFQNYALYPHMTVYDNMAFGLRLRKVPKEQRDKSFVAKDAEGKPLNWFILNFGKVPKEMRDDNGNIVHDENGNVVYVVKKKKDGSDKIDKNGNPVYEKRPYTDEERLGRIIYGEDGKPLLVEGKSIFGKPVTKMRKHTKEEIDAKVMAASKILGIVEYLQRKPKEMSGGQRQRVALGRAIVREPKVFLLDEPLSNLDAKLRTAMRSEISKLHNKLKTTFIYVTHDQVEAMTMGTRIVVMKDGFVQQIDSPRNLYRFPANKFVAGFIGTPQMNFYNGKVKRNGETLHITFDNTEVELDAPIGYYNKADRKYFDGEKLVTFGIRSEFLSVEKDKYPYKAKCRVAHVEELGTECLVYADFNLDSGDAVTESPTKVIIKALAGTEYEVGEVIEVSLGLQHLRMFDAETEKTIIPRIPHDIIVEGTVKSGKLNMLGADFVLPKAIALADGNYNIHVPTAAISLNGSVKASVIDKEVINGERLVHLQIGDRVLFALDNDTDLEGVKNVDIDLKQLTFENSEVKFGALPEYNTLSGKIVKDKDTDSKKLKFKIEVGGYSFDYPIEKAAFVVNGGGKNIFNKELKFIFKYNDVSISESGIAAQVEEVLDYGTEYFAKCKVGEETVYIGVDKDFNKTAVCFTLDVQNLGVFEVEREIRLV